MLLATLAVACLTLVPAFDPPTVAEKTEFRQTATAADVSAFLTELAAKSSFVRITELGTSGEGRTIPLVLVADPAVSSAEEARKSGKIVIALLGSIHPGECDGKEALLALARDIALARAAKAEGPVAADLLDHAVLAFIPLYNPDGNERVDPGNRPGQNGPETMGRRENAAGLDLNRDFVKLEAPETRALLRFIRTADPAILIDTHTTNGSFHRFPLTYDTIKNPAGDAALVAFARGTLLPAIASAAKEKHALDTFWYGNFEDGHSRWESYPDEPRYIVNGMGLRNRIGILTESYSYAPYRDRVKAQEAFIAECLNATLAQREDIRRFIREADERAAKADADDDAAGATPRRPVRGGRNRSAPVPRPDPVQTPASQPAQPTDDDRPQARTDEEKRTVVLASTMSAAPDKATIPGFVEISEEGRARPTAEPKEYTVDLFTVFSPAKSIERPWAYVVRAPASADAPAWLTGVMENLQRHGIKVDELREDLEIEATELIASKLTKSVRPFQGHTLSMIEASDRVGAVRLTAGSLIIRTAQPLGTFAAYLLEPAAADGLTLWNFFDAAIAADAPHPVVRLAKPVPMNTIVCPPLPEDRKPPQPLTFAVAQEDAPNLTGSPVSIGAWLDDEHFLQSKEGKLWKVHAATGRAERFFDPKPVIAALEQLPTISQRQAAGFVNRTNFNWDKGRTGFVFSHQNDLYYARFDGTLAARLTSTPEEEECVTISPDGAFVAFVRSNDLWVVDVATQRERALTTGGTDTLRRGKADWVYHEEIFNRSWTTHWWSPDSRRIAFLEIDSSPVDVYTLVNDIPEGLRVEAERYPKVGRPNPTFKVFACEVAGGTPAPVDISGYNPQDLLAFNIAWWPDSSSFMLLAGNRVQTWADALRCPADGGTPARLFRETTGAWVEPPDPPRFLKDGSFLFASERTGWKHYYHYLKDGSLIAPLTTGEWETRGLLELDEKNGHAYMSATRDAPIAENLYRISLKPGSGDGRSAEEGEPPSDVTTTELVRLTNAPGPHRCTVSPGGTYFTDAWSTPEQPTRVVLRRVDGGEIVRTLDTNPVRDLSRFMLGAYERVQIPMKDGFLVEGSILKPVMFDPSRRYPVWFMTYAGPHAPTITDGWSRRVMDEYLADAGFIVFRADPRSASGKGAISAWSAYKQLGIQELADIEETMAWLIAHPWVDAARIGMSGHSYGGFMTSYAMTHSKTFAAGIAGAPVTDWKDYDSIYTERYMLLPQDNTENYEKTSVVAAAKNLHGRLLLLHGMMDDNVHPQNATRLVRALQRADKQFDLMFYPESRHGLGGKHYQRLVFEFITRTLGGTTGESSSPSTPAERTGP